MWNGNPNQPNNPFKPFDMFKSKQMNGAQNPFGFGMQRVAGALAPQRNKSGMPTNTVPLPSLGGYGDNDSPSPWAQKNAATGMPSQYWGLPWWKQPSQYWNRDSWQGGTTVRDWMRTTGGDSYADYAAWMAQLQAQGMLDEPWTPNSGQQPNVNNKYWQEYHNTSFNPIYDKDGNVVGAAKDPQYDPEAYGYSKPKPWTLSGNAPINVPQPQQQTPGTRTSGPNRNGLLGSY